MTSDFNFFENISFDQKSDSIFLLPLKRCYFLIYKLFNFSKNNEMFQILHKGYSHQ